MLEGIEHIYKRKEHILILNPNLRGIITQGERSERIIKIERNNNKENANVKEEDAVIEILVDGDIEVMEIVKNIED